VYTKRCFSLIYYTLSNSPFHPLYLDFMVDISIYILVLLMVGPKDLKQNLCHCISPNFHLYVTNCLSFAKLAFHILCFTSPYSLDRYHVLPRLVASSPSFHSYLLSTKQPRQCMFEQVLPWLGSRAKAALCEKQVSICVRSKYPLFLFRHVFTCFSTCKQT